MIRISTALSDIRRSPAAEAFRRSAAGDGYDFGLYLHGASLDADTGETGHNAEGENGQDDGDSPATDDGITEEWEPDPVMPADDEWVE